MGTPIELPPALTEQLRRAQARGFIGPGSLEPHLRHAERFAAVVGGEPTLAVDLGSGGGLPGLVLILRWPGTRWILVEANQRRAAFLAEAAEALDVAGRVVVDARRAEEVGRDPDRRARADLVVSRAFGPPAVVAECAAPLLRPGGLLVVSEPPEGSGERWPPEPLATFGLAIDARQEPGFVRLRQDRLCPDQYPRRVGIPAKRPRF